MQQSLWKHCLLELIMKYSIGNYYSCGSKSLQGLFYYNSDGGCLAQEAGLIIESGGSQFVSCTWQYSAMYVRVILRLPPLRKQYYQCVLRYGAFCCFIVAGQFVVILLSEKCAGVMYKGNICPRTTAGRKQVLLLKVTIFLPQLVQLDIIMCIVVKCCNQL